ncbi:MAG: class II aldolase/adducin family protein [Actinobacteria bacterium]|jgi:L-fuculose-phosphate aldolase|nr:MAG: class II aldolase/adducin family protein [Actinomycetota bacterium]
MDEEKTLRELICDIGKRVWQRGMASANSGNISARLDADTVLITPTLVSKGFMRPEQLLVVTLEGEVLRGEGYPTTETPMHLRLYRARDDIGGVVHAHPPLATSFAVAGKALDLHLIPEAVIFLGEVPLVPFQPPGSAELAETIVPYLDDYDAVLMENHGVLCWGSNVEQSYHRLETVEFCAQVTMTAQVLGGARELPREPLENLLNIRKMMKGGG